MVYWSKLPMEICCCRLFLHFLIVMLFSKLISGSQSLEILLIYLYFRFLALLNPCSPESEGWGLIPTLIQGRSHFMTWNKGNRETAIYLTAVPPHIPPWPARVYSPNKTQMLQPHGSFSKFIEIKPNPQSFYYYIFSKIWITQMLPKEEIYLVTLDISLQYCPYVSGADSL